MCLHLNIRVLTIAMNRILTTKNGLKCKKHCENVLVKFTGGVLKNFFKFTTFVLSKFCLKLNYIINSTNWLFVSRNSITHYWLLYYPVL